jgi:His-Xaa-Ser system radical SAM maturase HxsC
MHLHAQGEARNLNAPVVGRIATASSPPTPVDDHIFLCREPDEFLTASGYNAVLSIPPAGGSEVCGIFGLRPLAYLTDGDVVALHPSGLVQVLYRHTSAHNTLLLTQRCNSLCVMCSQPPRDEDDSWRVPIILRALDLIDPACSELGLTGGEPTLLGDSFFAIVERARDRLPWTGLHVLTNGRSFCDRHLANRLGQLRHPDLMLGIPLYSDVDSEHDFVVQARGAYNETIAGLYHLAEAGVAIELRVVIHRSTYRRLPNLAEFIARNLPFISHVALMGLEMFGFVHWNMESVWIDPATYQTELEEAVRTLALRDIEPVIFNHQLCVLRRSIWPFSVKSISDWKNVYLPKCDTCAAKSMCGGFFHSGAKQHSTSIRPLSAVEIQI